MEQDQKLHFKQLDLTFFVENGAVLLKHRCVVA